jgi:endonuclease/exonuclease/phosphatase family metal-dependent hydrolase
MWELRKRLKSCHYAPWLVIGDFNEVLWDFKHFCSRKRPARQMLDFREVLSYCDLHDVGYTGVPWTFDNKQAGGRNVRVRLDRAVASPSWSEWFPQVRVKHLISASSDHCPIFLDLEKDHNVQPQRRTARYEVMWEREETLS